MSQNLVQKQFGDNAERYVASKVHAQGASLIEMVKLAAPQPHWLALDVAPGGGHSALAIARHVRRVIALDITFPMLRAARAFASEQEQRNICWVQGDGERLPFDNARFDLITCRVALHHFPHQAAAIADWARCLKPGGRLVLVDNIGPDDPAANAYINAFEKSRDPSHGRLYPQSEVAEFLERAGLLVISNAHLRKPMGFHAWVRRMQVNATDQQRLIRMLWDSDGDARRFLNPQGTGEETTFDLWEGLFLAQKPASSR